MGTIFAIGFGVGIGILGYFITKNLIEIAELKQLARLLEYMQVYQISRRDGPPVTPEENAMLDEICRFVQAEHERIRRS